MFIPWQHEGGIVARAANTDGQQKSKNTKTIVIICVVVVVLVVTLLVLLFLVLRILRKSNYGPKYIPGTYLKKKWNNWTPGISYGQVPNRSTSPQQAEDTAYRGAAVTTTTAQPRQSNNSSNVRRDNSVRSIITLPSYSMSPKPTEQVIAREGEREGMDVVVEFPETAEEEESRREEHMEALYQVRVQRRRENEEREARRRERRDALARGDYRRVEQLRQEQSGNGRNRSDSNNSNQSSSRAMLQAQQQSRERDHISSVSYAALGYVRHDGSRMRANSAESDHNPLLPNAAGMGDHARGDSVSSIASDGGNLTPVASNAPLTRQSTSEQDEEDVASLTIPPPDYDHLEWGNAPSYDSHESAEGDNTRDLLLRPVPTIQIETVSSDGGEDTAPGAPEHEREHEREHELPSGTQDHASGPVGGDGSAPRTPESKLESSKTAPATQTDAGSSSSAGGERESSVPQLPPFDNLPAIEIEPPDSSDAPSDAPSIEPSGPKHPNEQNTPSSANTSTTGHS